MDELIMELPDMMKDVHQKAYRQENDDLLVIPITWTKFDE